MTKMGICSSIFNSDINIAVKTCPHCRLINPENAESCDCGFSFTSGTLRECVTPTAKGLGEMEKIAYLFFAPAGLIASLCYYLTGKKARASHAIKVSAVGALLNMVVGMVLRSVFHL